MPEIYAVYKDKGITLGVMTNSMSEKKQTEMDICDEWNTAKISIESHSFHYAWEEKDVKCGHKIKRNKENSKRKKMLQ